MTECGEVISGDQLCQYGIEIWCFGDIDSIFGLIIVIPS
jgi:hypothetical protein